MPSRTPSTGSLVHPDGFLLAALLRECDSARYQRLQSLIRASNGRMVGLDAAMHWVNQQRQQGAFKGEVAGPLGLEIKVKMGKYAPFLEQVRFMLNVWMACVTGCHTREAWLSPERD